MLAYHNDPALKDRFVAELERHRAADMISAGQYSNDSKTQFCAVGCSIHSLDPAAKNFGNHGAYESLIGVPRMIARIQDRLFEGMPKARRADFVVSFGKAIVPGADLSLVGWQFLHRIVGDVLAKHGTDAVRAGCAAALDVVGRRARGETLTRAEAEDAWRQATAARSAARSARSAAEAAAAGAWAAAAEAEAAEAARSAAWAAAAAAYSNMADILLELLAAAPVVAVAA